MSLPTKPPRQGRKCTVGFPAKFQPSVSGSEYLQAGLHRLEGIMRERFQAHAAEQMMHHRIADQDDVLQLAGVASAPASSSAISLADLLADQFLQRRLATAVHAQTPRGS